MAGRWTDEDARSITQDDMDRIRDALKDEEFRKLLVEYCEEIKDPENQKLYRREFGQLERERGYLVRFVDPTPGYVIKTSSHGERKAFVNVCSNDTVDRPSYWRSTRGRLEWRLPYALAPPRDDFDSNMKRCIACDVVFHPNCVAMALRHRNFKDMLTETALDAADGNHDLRLDRGNLKFPKLAYKGTPVAAVVRTKDPHFESPPDSADSSLLDSLYPQKCPEPRPPCAPSETSPPEYATPKYTLIHRRDIQIKEFTYEDDAKRFTAIPSALVAEIHLPLLSTASDVDLDVVDRRLSLISEKTARYKLELNLPYRVDGDSGSAKFDTERRTLVVTMPVIPATPAECPRRNREDSGVESDSPCHSDEDNSPPSGPDSEPIPDGDDGFFDANASYVVPPYACDVFENVLVLTLDVKNVDAESLTVKETPAGAKIKFESVGAGLFPIRYGLNVVAPRDTSFGRPAAEVWDNNVTLQLEICETERLDHVLVGLDAPLARCDLGKSVTADDIKACGALDADADDATLSEEFLLYDVCYSVPPHNLNMLDGVLAFTFQVENVDEKSFQRRFFSERRGLRLKFSSDRDGDRHHYALCLKLPHGFAFGDHSADVQKSNTVLRLEVENDTPPAHYHIGLSDFDLKKRSFEPSGDGPTESGSGPVPETDVEIVATGINETSISLRKNESGDIPSDDPKARTIPKRVVQNSDPSGSGSFKGILKYKTHLFERSLSESNVDGMEYGVSPALSLSSADCIPEESSSLKKTVRFSDVITKQTFRTNSSILGQKTKNQRKRRNKKRALDRRSSEGDPSDSCSLDIDNEDVFIHNIKSYKENININRRDRASTSECENRNEIDDVKGVCRNGRSVFGNVDAGKYLDVHFKNDLIFDLDM